MQAMPVGELKRHFSRVLDDVRRGESVAIHYGRRKAPVAMIVPYSQCRQRRNRPLGLLAGKARCVFHGDWTITDEELLRS